MQSRIPRAEPLPYFHSKRSHKSVAPSRVTVSTPAPVSASRVCPLAVTRAVSATSNAAYTAWRRGIARETWLAGDGLRSKGGATSLFPFKGLTQKRRALAGDSEHARADFRQPRLSVGRHARCARDDQRGIFRVARRNRARDVAGRRRTAFRRRSLFPYFHSKRSHKSVVPVRVTVSTPAPVSASRVCPLAVTRAVPATTSAAYSACRGRMATSPSRVRTTSRSASPSNAAHCGVTILIWNPFTAYFPAFLSTSSMPPAKRNALSGMSSCLPSMISRKPRSVSAMGT